MLVPKTISDLQFTNRNFVYAISIIGILYHIIAILMFTKLGKLQLKESKHKDIGLAIATIAFFIIVNNIYLFSNYQLGDIKFTIMISTLLSIFYMDKLFNGYEYYASIKEVMIILLQMLIIYLNYKSMRTASKFS